MAETLQVNDPAADPLGTGLDVYAFLRQLQAALKPEHAGRFLVGGRMAAPPVVDYADGEVDHVPNPYAPAVKTDPAKGLWCRPMYYNGGSPAWQRTLSAFNVPAILSRAAVAQDGTVGWILVNPGNSAASWRGTFRPELYGWPADASVSVHLVVTETAGGGGVLDFSAAGGELLVLL